MKKLICIILTLLCLCSCSKGEVSPKLLSISFTAELNYYNEEYVFQGEILEDCTMKISIKEPEELKDLNITVTDKAMTADYKGITYEANEATMPFSRVIQTFYFPLSAIAKDSSLKADKNGEISGEFGGDKCSLTVSPTGLPQTFSIKSKQLNLRFYNISIIKED